MRHALNGKGRRLLAGGALDTTGCGDGIDITSCSGYELVTNISLMAYSGGSGWQPLGSCDGHFSATFEGNGWTISDLNISRSKEDCVGLFGHIAADSEIRNLTLHAETVIGKTGVGGLVGRSLSSRIHSSSVVVGQVRGTGDDVGGLVGRSSRIHSSSVVAAEVSGTGDAVGGLVGAGELVQIYSSSVVVDEVKGGDLAVGGLVGWGPGGRIYSSSVVVGEVSGKFDVGGLVGDGEEGSEQAVRIYSSSVVAGKVSGADDVGGLIGSGYLGRVYSSSVVVGNLSGTGDLGGLIGDGFESRIHSSSVVVGELSGTGSNIGGLTGDGGSASITSSSAVVGKVSGTGNIVGGLAGAFSSGRVAYSYVVSSSNISMLAGSGSGTGVASYWDSNTSGRNTGNLGDPKTSDELRMPTNYTGIYDRWDNETDIFGEGDVPLAVWCDGDNSESIEEGEKTGDNLVWDFGTNMEYPAIRCTPIAPSEWRSWWFLNGTGEPQLNRTRLDEWLP